jgi:hypothetical protein
MFRKNWYLFTPLAIVGLPALSLVYYMFVFGYPPAEAVEATTHFFQSSTRYAMKYSDRHFALVKPGMDGKEVYSRIGVPFERRNNDTEWLYSLPNGLTRCYHERMVIFAKDSKGIPRVKEVVRAFHAE